MRLRNRARFSFAQNRRGWEKLVLEVKTRWQGTTSARIASAPGPRLSPFSFKQNLTRKRKKTYKLILQNSDSCGSFSSCRNWKGRPLTLLFGDAALGLGLEAWTACIFDVQHLPTTPTPTHSNSSPPLLHLHNRSRLPGSLYSLIWRF